MVLKPKKAYFNHLPATHGGLFSSGLKNHDVLDFSTNVNPLGISKKVDTAIKKGISKASIYPDPDSRELLKSLAKYTKISPRNIVIGNGATEIIYHFCNAFLSERSHVLIPIPTFLEYEKAVRLNCSKITFFRTFDLELDISRFIQKIPYNGCVFICNPNNPTGKLVSKTNIRKIVFAAKKRNAFVFLDECFIELVPNSNESLVNNIHHHSNLFILRSLTKSFGLAGIRLGYGVGPRGIISLLDKTKIPWNISVLAQLSGIASLSDKSHINKAKKLIKRESKYLKNSISKIPGFHVIDSSTNFLLINTEKDSRILQKKLLEKKILVRDCSTFRGLKKDYIRIAIKTHRENQRLVSSLEMLG